MNKKIPALIAAFLITICVALGMLTVSAGAYFNKDGVPVVDSPVSATATAGAVSVQEAQIQQLQDLVNQYQAREQQYQNQIKDASQQISQANQQIQQYQGLLMALQNRGVISITADGRIAIP